MKTDSTETATCRRAMGWGARQEEREGENEKTESAVAVVQPEKLGRRPLSSRGRVCSRARGDRETATIVGLVTGKEKRWRR